MAENAEVARCGVEAAQVRGIHPELRQLAQHKLSLVPVQNVRLDRIYALVHEDHDVGLGQGPGPDVEIRQRAFERSLQATRLGRVETDGKVCQKVGRNRLWTKKFGILERGSRKSNSPLD